MTIGQWLSFQGRIGRKIFWLGYILPLFAASIVASILDAALGLAPGGDAMPADGSEIGPVGGLVSLLSIWPSLAGSIKRLHDRDRSGWWIGGFYLFAAAVAASALLAVVVSMPQGGSGAASVTLVGSVLLLGYGLWLIVETGFLRGTPGPNRYGPDPLGGQGGPQWQQQPMGPPQGWQPQGWQAPQPPSWQPPPAQGWQGAPPPGWQPPPQQGWQGPPPSGPVPPGYGQPPPGYGQPPPGQGPTPRGSVPPIRRD